MLALISLCIVPLIDVVAAAHVHNAHSHVSRSPLPDTWYHEDSHPVHNLFRRAPGDKFPEVGSPEWASKYPTKETIYTAKMPDGWVAALDAAVAAGKIPNVPIAKDTGANPVYPPGSDPLGQVVCSATYKQCRHKDDIWDAPDGMFGTGFDDGPTEVSPKLYDFLQKNEISSTQFMIGVGILSFPNQFKMAYNTLNLDIASHTYTHPHLTTKTNMEILAELGWTSQIIYDSTGGKVPKFVRPPTGDSDNRVRAIAKEVFGLTMILWNRDTEDWSLTVTGGTTPQKINASMAEWLSGPKSPGLIILEHELSDASIQAFIDAYPVIQQNNWNMLSVAQLNPEKSAYRSGNLLIGSDGANDSGDDDDSTTSLSSSTIAITSTRSSTGTTSPSGTRGSLSASSSSSPSSTAPNSTNSNGAIPFKFELTAASSMCAMLLALLL